jgi:hypothetical protein
MFEVKSAIAWMGIFVVGLLALSAFAAEGRYFPFISIFCLVVIVLFGFSSILVVLEEIRDTMTDQKRDHEA